MKNNETYISLNALTEFKDENGHFNFEADKKAVKAYIDEKINPNTKKFKSFRERLNFLIDNDYYDKDLLAKYNIEFIEKLTKKAYDQHFTFPNFMGAVKFYNAYALKTNDHKEYLENYEDRVVMNALFLADGDEDFATSLLMDIIHNRFQPATPTFLNAGKKKTWRIYIMLFASC